MAGSRHGSKYIRLLLVVALLTGMGGLASFANAATAVYAPEAASVDSLGAFGPNESQAGSFSDDGRYVVFLTSSMLSPADINVSYWDIYRRDRVSGDTVLVNEPRVGQFYVDENSQMPSVSDDGNLVAFYTYQDLVPEDTNGSWDMYVKDMTSGAYHQLDVYGDGSGVGVNAMKICGDGSTVVFETSDSIAAEDYGRKDIYVYDLATDTTTWVTETNTDMSYTDAGTRDPDISDDGSKVVFVTGKDFDPADTNGGQDVYLADLGAGTFTMIDAGGDGSSQGDESWYPKISGDGSTVVWYTDYSWVLEDIPHQADVYRWDVATGAVTWLTQWPETAVDWDRGARSPAISDDGRWVVCYTGKDLTPDDTNGHQDLYLIDGQTLEPLRMDVNDGNGLDGNTWGINISGDGTTVCFDTPYGLASGDGNGNRDVYVLGSPVILTVPDLYTAGRNVTLNVPAATGVLANDNSVSPLTISGPSTAVHGAVDINPDGSFTYTPDTDYEGPDTIIYYVTDGTYNSQGVATIDVVNYAPIAVDDAYNVSQNGYLYVVAPGLLGNDSDANGDTLSAYKSADPANGSVTIAPDGAFTYAPNPGFIGVDQFSYVASDGQDVSQAAVVTITVQPSGDPTPSEVGGIFRFYNRLNGTHFYTSSASERDAVLQKLRNTYTYEGVAFWVDPSSDTQPLYRFYNKKSNSHFYTASATEKSFVQTNLSATFTYEGIGFNVSTAGAAGKVAIYRFFNVKTGSHFYTASSTERDHVIATWPSLYRYEGVAFYVSGTAN